VHDAPEGLVDGVGVDRVAVTVGEHPQLRVLDPTAANSAAWNARHPSSTASVVAVDGLSKPVRTAANPKDYKRALKHRKEFRKRRSVLGIKPKS